MILAFAAACGETERLAPPTLTRTVAVATATAATPSPRTTAPTATAAPTTPAPTTAAPATTAPTAQSATARPSATSTPSAAPTATPRPSPTTTAQPSFVASLPAMPALPAISGTVVLSTTTLFEIAPGTTRIFDASTLAQERGVAAPPCPGSAWVAAWRATDAVTATVRTSTSRFDLGRGRWGTADMSCATLELRNDTANSVAGELAFSIATR